MTTCARWPANWSNGTNGEAGALERTIEAHYDRLTDTDALPAGSHARNRLDDALRVARDAAQRIMTPATAAERRREKRLTEEGLRIPVTVWKRGRPGSAAQRLGTLILLGAIATAVADDEVRIERNVDYLGPDREEKADLYLPAKLGPSQRCPAVVIIHGGGWSGGDKGAAREINIGTNLARNGYVGMSINYALATKEGTAPTWPQNLHDCKTAVRWLRRNAERLHVDPERIGAIGGSAGGHLAAMLAV